MSDIERKIEKTLVKIEKLELEVLELKKENEKSKSSVAECDLLFKKILRDMSFNYELSIKEMSMFKYIIKEIFFYIKNVFDKGQKNEINIYNFSMEINIKRFFLNEKFNFIKIKNILENILNSCNVIIDYENTFIEQDIIRDFFLDEKKKSNKYMFVFYIDYKFIMYLKEYILGTEKNTYNSYLYKNNTYKGEIKDLDEIDKIFEIAFAEKEYNSENYENEKYIFEYIAKEIIKTPYKNLKINVFQFLDCMDEKNIYFFSDWILNAFKIHYHLFSGGFGMHHNISGIFYKKSQNNLNNTFYMYLKLFDNFLEYFSDKNFILKRNSLFDYYLGDFNDKTEKILNIVMGNYNFKNSKGKQLFNLILKEIILTNKENLTIDISNFYKTKKIKLEEYEETMFNLKEKLTGNIEVYTYKKWNNGKTKGENIVLRKNLKSFVEEFNYPHEKERKNLTNIFLELTVNKSFLTYLQNIENNKKKIPYFDYY